MFIPCSLAEFVLTERLHQLGLLTTALLLCHAAGINPDDDTPRGTCGLHPVNVEGVQETVKSQNLLTGKGRKMKNLSQHVKFST